MIKRKHIEILSSWKSDDDRKPLILRGARQVGKTALVREFSSNYQVFIEINFDETPEKSSFFKGTTVDEVIKYLEADNGIKIVPRHTLLFLDEIQSSPEALAMLRYFYEKYPEIHVIAAGSLLEFLLADHSFSMPVGRVEYCFLNPLSFEEFLDGIGEEALVSFMNEIRLTDAIPDAIHQKLMRYLKIFMLTGGMPEAVANWIKYEDFSRVQRVHASILQTYEDDFSKYAKRLSPELLKLVLTKIPSLVGSKVRYSNLDNQTAPSTLKKVLSALSAARVISLIYHTSGNGMPLGAEKNEKKFKALFLDIGLYSCALSINLIDLQNTDDLLLIHNGACAEQFIGQELLVNQDFWRKPELFYWHREQKGSNSEIDYLRDQASNRDDEEELKKLEEINQFIMSIEKKYEIA